ncbi:MULTISPECIES: thioredoxin family protein [Hymenobacter]|uniref:Thioredoxin family protein n=1 Tax=Hymenobacter armeniacus TaxID=2771358 RepID=A0ABR8JXZ8_9BACT|nr:MULTISPECIES: thioredoxin family protein [Hymenobacter]MBD2723490.1 thioredoxin family protein [Hymenobacter armeniacus]MBJ6107499.1 thioredoxin family protein [Hymenobacter sp. BT523]
MSELIASAPVLTAERLNGAYSYASYRQLLDELMAENRTTGTTQTEQIVQYARLNIQRMQRLDKTIQLLPEVQRALDNLTEGYEWLVITEGWCGDAAQIVPVLEAMAHASQGKIATRYVLRDENLDLMDRYLTNGSRSIPKLVVLHTDTLTEAATWGPRPAPAQELFVRLKQEGVSYEDFATQLHGWYAKDRTRSTQRELLELLKRLR